LALVMCRDPLEKALKSYLWSIFMQQVIAKDLTLRDADTMEKFINVLVEKNMDLCSILVEKYVTDRAVSEVEGMITQNVESRVEHKNRYPHNMFYDSNVQQSPWLQQIPEHLRQSPGNLSPMFLKIYKDFYNHYAGYTARLPPGLPAHERLNFQPPRYHGQVADQHCYAFQRQKELRHIQQQLSLRGRQDPAQSEQERQKQLMANKESAEKILGMITGHIESLQSSPLRLASLMNIHVPLHCTDDTLEAVAALSNLPNDSEIRKTLRGVRRWCASLVQMQNLPGTDETFGGMVKTVFKLLSSQFYKPEMIQTRPDCVSVLHVDSRPVMQQKTLPQTLYNKGEDW